MTAIRIQVALLGLVLTACDPAEATSDAHPSSKRVAAPAPAPAPSDGDGVVVQTASTPITYRNIRCPRRLRETAGEEACRRAEERDLRQHVLEHVIDCAAEVRGIRLTPSESEAIEQQVLTERAAVQRIIDRQLLVLRGVLRVQEGEPLDVVATDLAKAGVKVTEIEAQLDYLGTAEATRNALAADHIAKAAAATRNFMRRDRLVVKLKEHVRDRARDKGRAAHEEERALLDAALQRCRMRVVDDRYEMPDLKGIFQDNAR